MATRTLSRLLTLPQEFQDMIYEELFSSQPFTISGTSSSMHPFLLALDKQHYRPIYFAKKSFFKHTVFKIPLSLLRAFIKRNKQYLHLIKHIHILPSSIYSSDYVRINSSLSIRAMLQGIMIGNIHELSPPTWTRVQATGMVERWFGELQREMAREGLRKGVLKVAVSGWFEGEPVRTMWTAKPLNRIERYLEIAGWKRKG